MIDELEQYRQIRAGIITQKIAFEQLLLNESVKLNMINEKIMVLENAQKDDGKTNPKISKR